MRLNEQASPSQSVWPPSLPTFGQLSLPVKEPFQPLPSRVAPPKEWPPPRKMTCSRTVSPRIVSNEVCTPAQMQPGFSRVSCKVKAHTPAAACKPPEQAGTQLL